MTVRKKWTAEEEEKLRELVKTHSIREIAEILERTCSSVKHKLQRLNIPLSLEATYGKNYSLQLSETEKAYLAGFLDGDGMIGFHISFRKKFRLRPEVKFSNTDKRVIDWILQKISFMHEVSDDPHDERHKRRYHALIRGPLGCRAILRELLPYLIVKREAAEMLLKYCESRARKPKNSPLSEEEVELILKFRRRFGRSPRHKRKEEEILPELLKRIEKIEEE